MILLALAAGADVNQKVGYVPSKSREERRGGGCLLIRSFWLNALYLLSYSLAPSQDLEGRTPLHAASYCGQCLCCELLLQKGRT